MVGCIVVMWHSCHVIVASEWRVGGGVKWAVVTRKPVVGVGNGVVVARKPVVVAGNGQWGLKHGWWVVGV
jgi:hypothetical protein